MPMCAAFCTLSLNYDFTHLRLGISFGFAFDHWAHTIISGGMPSDRAPRNLNVVYYQRMEKYNKKKPIPKKICLSKLYHGSADRFALLMLLTFLMRLLILIYVRERFGINFHCALSTHHLQWFVTCTHVPRVLEFGVLWAVEYSPSEEHTTCIAISILPQLQRSFHFGRAFTDPIRFQSMDGTHHIPPKSLFNRTIFRVCFLLTSNVTKTQWWTTNWTPHSHRFSLLFSFQKFKRCAMKEDS